MASGDQEEQEEGDHDSDRSVIEALSSAPIGIDIDPDALGDLRLDQGEEDHGDDDAGFVSRLRSTFSGVLDTLFSPPQGSTEEINGVQGDNEDDNGQVAVDGNNDGVDGDER